MKPIITEWSHAFEWAYGSLVGHDCSGRLVSNAVLAAVLLKCYFSPYQLSATGGGLGGGGGG